MRVAGDRIVSEADERAKGREPEKFPVIVDRVSHIVPLVPETTPLRLLETTESRTITSIVPDSATRRMPPTPFSDTTLLLTVRFPEPVPPAGILARIPVPMFFSLETRSSAPVAAAPVAATKPIPSLVATIWVLETTRLLVADGWKLMPVAVKLRTTQS